MNSNKQHPMKSSKILNGLAMVAIVCATCLVASRAHAAGEIAYVLTTPTDPAQPGQVLEFDLTVHNLTTTSQPVRVDFSVPQYTRFACCTGAGSGLNHDFGTLTAGQSITYQIYLNVLGTDSVPDGATITLMVNDLARAASVSRSVVVRDVPVLGLSLSTEEGTVAPGSNFTYTLAASNLSDGSLAGGALRLPVP
ncbi:MAG TPA: hypothetical protein VK474_09770, partial [Chthoniobacterales bacterium]|nr:hypothetical protein [Chthoniobacterales bacterium]